MEHDFRVVAAHHAFRGAQRNPLGEGEGREFESLHPLVLSLPLLAFLSG